MGPIVHRKTGLRTRTLNSFRSQFHCLPAGDPGQVAAKSLFSLICKSNEDNRAYLTGVLGKFGNNT